MLISGLSKIGLTYHYMTHQLLNGCVGISSDDMLFAKETGIVRFERKGRFDKQVSVYPQEQSVAQ